MIHTPTPPDGKADGEKKPLSKGAKSLLTMVSVSLGLVIMAPIVLSGQDLYNWARAVRGLNLSSEFALLVPVALDVSAAACIGMVIIGAVWRRERPGLFGILVWVFALTSAYAQYTHGIAERDAGRAQDAWWLFPALALLGPTLLEVTLHRVRGWARKDAGETLSGAAGFGTRWIPGVAFRETLAAWAASRREGIALAADAIAHVRETKAIAKLSDVDAIRYAFGALGTFEPHAARVWLQSRGRAVDQAAIDQAAEIELNSDQPTIQGELMPISPAGPIDLATASKTTAIHIAHTALAPNLPARSVITFLAERDVLVSESAVYKARRLAQQSTGDVMAGWMGDTGSHPVINGQRRDNELPAA
jgi:hypothetical protein